MERRLAAILAADVVGYSRLMEDDEEATLATLNAYREIIDGLVADHRGRVFGSAGDSVIAEFASPVEAVRCATEVQQELGKRNADVALDQRMAFRIGVNLGDVVAENENLHGDGVNIAARLEELAEPGGVCVSGTIYDHLAGKLDLTLDDLGEQKLKNISRLVRVWRWAGEGTAQSRDIHPPLPDKPSIAVLPFTNMSGDPEQEYFSDGITEDIITGLCHMRHIFVIARNSSFAYRGSVVDVKRVGKDLGVRYVLEGSVRRGGDRIRVTAQLIDVGTDVHVWADRFDGTLDDVFALQDDITAKIISAVGPEITVAEMQRARGKRSESFDAWDRYLQALQPFYAVDKAGYEEATALLEEAIELDPRFSTSYATLARCHVYAGFHGWSASAREVIYKAEKFARQAVALDEQDPFAHLALGFVHMINREPDRSVNELNRALELNPNLSIAHGYLSNTLAFLGRSEEALAAAERAIRGSPRDPERYIWYIGIMNAHFAAERYEECVKAAEQAVLLQPNFYGGHIIMASALPYLERIEEAKQAGLRAREVMPRLTLGSAARNPMFVREGDVARLLDGLRRAGLPE